MASFLSAVTFVNAPQKGPSTKADALETTAETCLHKEENLAKPTASTETVKLKTGTPSHLASSASASMKIN